MQPTFTQIDVLLKKRAERAEMTNDEYETLVSGIGHFSKPQLLSVLKIGDADHLRDVARRELTARSAATPHWTVTPGFIIGVLAMVFAAIAAWPVIHDWLQKSPPRPTPILSTPMPSPSPVATESSSP